MHAILYIVLSCSVIYHAAYAVILKSKMSNKYPQIAVGGCNSNKANLYYDVQRQVWVEHLISSCVDTEQSILDFCKQAYPSLHIKNIIRLDIELKFSNWCELLPSKTDEIPRCKSSNSLEESIRPYRCLHDKSQQEDQFIGTDSCSIKLIQRPRDCYQAAKWQELATLDCAQTNTILNSTLSPFHSCGLAQFHAVKFICCALKDNEDKNDYETNAAEDDSINELLVVPQTTTVKSPRRIIAMSLGSREPNWMKDYQQWNADNGYFADDEDIDDEQEEIKLSSPKKSHLTISEHERFTKEKVEFKRKYTDKLSEIKSRWQVRQNELQKLALENPSRAQTEYEQSEIEFRQDYDFLKQTATRERSRINQLHENNLDSILDMAKIETENKLNSAWKDNLLKTETLKQALYDYIHVLLRDRIHLANRYSRLQATEPEQAKVKRVPIHERLRSIANRINQALTKLRQYPTIQSKIQSTLNELIDEYADVNQAAEKLLIAYNGSSVKPLGQDEKQIYPFANKKIEENVNEYDYGKITGDDEDDDYEDDDDEEATTVVIPSAKPVDFDELDWDVKKDELNSIRIETINDDLIMNSRRASNKQRHFFMTYLPYIIGILFLLCLIFGVLIFRILIQQRRRARYGNDYEKNYVFTEIDSATPDDRALHALQANGYENPTYRFFESQTPKC